MQFSYLKATHIVFVVSWFAALFYIVRLFIYATEAQQKDDVARPILTSQLLLMQRRLWWVIGWPAMIGTVITGTWLIALQPVYYFSQRWMLLKLSAVVLLLFYHAGCSVIMRQQHKDRFKNSSLQLRFLNELATVFLVAIVFLVVVKSTAGLLWGVLGLLGFAAILMVAVLLYRKSSGRKKNK